MKSREHGGRASAALLWATAAVLSLGAWSGKGHCATFYVAVDGSNDTGDGSEAGPWATLAHAINSGIPADGGHVIVVRDGSYNGPNYIHRGFPAMVTVQAEHAYGVLLSNLERDGGGAIVSGEAAIQLYVEGQANITLEGFVISNYDPAYACAPDGSERGWELVHFQDATHVVFRNNIVFGNNAPGTCDDMIKVNRGSDAFYPREITITGNIFFDHPRGGGVDLIDSVRPGELDITENIFFVRNTDHPSQSFITIKREVPEAIMPDWARPPRNPRFIIARTVFLNWGGNSDQAFIQFGEDGVSEHEITNSLIENNLFIGNSPAPMAAPVQLKGVRGITMRANTVVGDLPGGAYGLRIGTEGDNPTVSDIAVLNNIWCDPAGTMGERFLNIYGDVDVSSITLGSNLFWNEGNALPAAEDPAPSTDPGLIEADPLLQTDQGGMVLPVWDADAGRFASGTGTIREEFERLVLTYGGIPGDSPARDAADPAAMPALDILGRARDGSPDRGCFEYAGDVIPDPLDALPDAAADAATDPAADLTVDGTGDADQDPGGDGDGSGGCGCSVI